MPERPGLRVRYRVAGARSVVAIAARSNAGPITFGASGLSGEIEATVGGGRILPDAPVSARLDLPVERLTSGNALYDAELLRRIDARRYPMASVELQEARQLGPPGLYAVVGAVTIHDVTKHVDGSVTIESLSESELVLSGEQTFDIRDFDVSTPSMLMLRIYPDVRVHLYLEATAEG